MSLTEVLTNQPICIDNGSGTIKAGFAGEDQPKCFFGTCVGRPKHTRIMAGALEGDCFIGPRVQEYRGLLRLKYPLEHGIVTDWADMERIWQHVFSDGLHSMSEEHPVLLTEAPLNPRANRDRAAQVMFETFNVPALFTSIQAVLALYASGRTTGLVLDSGDGVSHTVPVYEGFAITQAIRRSEVAGRDVTEYLQLLLRKAGLPMVTSAEKEIVRDMKERTCYLALDPAREERDYLSIGAGKGEVYHLPDGQKFDVCAAGKYSTLTSQLGAERFRAPEILFNPEIIGSEYPGLDQQVISSLGLVDMDLRKPLYANIVLSGGSTLTKGFGDRLLNTVRKVAVKDTKIKIYAPPERKYSTWIGASILASLSTFRKMWVSAEEYQEDPDIIHRKCM